MTKTNVSLMALNISTGIISHWPSVWRWDDNISNSFLKGKNEEHKIGVLDTYCSKCFVFSSLTHLAVPSETILLFAMFSEASSWSNNSENKYLCTGCPKSHKVI